MHISMKVLSNETKVHVIQVTLKKSGEDFAELVGDQNTPAIVDVGCTAFTFVKNDQLSASPNDRDETCKDDVMDDLVDKLSGREPPSFQNIRSKVSFANPNVDIERLDHSFDVMNQG